MVDLQDLPYRTIEIDIQDFPTFPIDEIDLWRTNTNTTHV